ncbi:MAG: DUF58 protein, partial [Gammaproteobacteria bacterium]|nr:DUF58 protein [Gammaproteobacteria bacterium]
AVQISVPVLVRLNQSVAGISLHTGRIQAQQGGDYHSTFKGRGMEFDESRLYQPGDDIRNIDWRVTARTNKTHTKLFREERERPVFVWVDFRRPMFFATRGSFKAVLAAKLAALLAWSANRQGDRVGGVIFSESVHHELKPQRGKTGVLRLINQLVQHPAWTQHSRDPGDSHDCGKALSRLRRVARPGSLIFLISDFRDMDDPALAQISTLSANNEVVMIMLYDPLEKSLPAVGRYRVSDGAEELLVDTYDRDRVDRYRGRFLTHLERFQQLARKLRSHLVLCSTTDDPVVVLTQGL